MKKIIIVSFLLGLLIACSKEELTNSIILDDETKPTEVDNWINTNITEPYNIEVKYKWDDEETDLAKNLVPPKADTVVTFLNVLKTLWIDTYVDQAGKDFFKKLSPKQILLIGSPNFNSDGTITEGTAEGGRKIILYSVNNFNPRGKEEIRHMIHVVHHEFAHIMHQTKDYSTDFNKITPEGYTSTWFNTNTETARNAGFITAYAQASTDEDFVEMISNFLINSNQEWENILASIQNPEAVTALRKKEAIMVDYFLKSWGIDIYEFQQLVSSEITRLTNE